MDGQPVDFVIAWVDGNDKEWQKQRQKYKSGFMEDNSEVRFRDWDNLQYWFRGVEEYAPWVNHIYFITWGHVPQWLNLDNPKLKIVNHKDYIPEKYLPTFNSHTIELNMHRIQGLSRQFVYFNDDMFLTAPVTKEMFFKNDLPRDTFALNVICYGKDTAGLFNTNDMMVVNTYFDKVIQQKKYWKKWFHPKNGMKNVLRTALLMPWRWFNQWVFKYWQLAKGTFEPISWKRGKCFHIHEDVTPAIEAIRGQNYKMVCLNDTGATTEWEKKREEIKAAFQEILPRKSSFEK